MLIKLPLVTGGAIVDWLRRRAERKAQLNVTDELSQSQDDMLTDIGIARDDLTHAFRSGGKS
jgi:hypothetical protein